VSDWLERERQKASTKTKKLHIHKSKSPPARGKDETHPHSGSRRRADSIDSESSEIGFDKLQHILEESMASMGLTGVPRHAPKFSRRGHRLSISRPGYSRAASSDTDYVDGDAIVPDCDVWLDNSKTLAYSACAAGAEDPAADAVLAEKERKTWLIFRNEIIRIAHTLRLKGWRQVPLDDGESIEVQRLSGALTNAVYVVTPPKHLMDSTGRKPPHRILLRIYGPQAESLIDRENELKVLQRLARKRIGPRLLGTFKNGRFEQFFNAVTLTPRDLRDPETSKQIAKRMRELHDGIELLPLERESGPGVWKNWDQWRDNVARIIKFLDKRLEDAGNAQPSPKSVHAWQANGYVCGMPAEQFIATVDKYRAHVNSVYESQKALKEWLVFAHNDVRFLRANPSMPDDSCVFLVLLD
jgi:choline kinase